MKLLRYGAPGREKPGLADKDGNIRDLSKVITQIDDAMLSPRNLARLARVKPETLPIVRGNPRLGVPYAGISKFVAIGLNYRDHAEESGLPIPPEPIVFMKATTCLCGPNDDTIMPKNSQKLDYEVELGVVIGTKAQHVPESKALDYVAGYTRGERRLRAPLPDGARRPVGPRQGLRHLRPRGTVARHHRRDHRPAVARHVARRERREAPARQHAHHDLRAARRSSPT